MGGRTGRVAFSSKEKRRLGCSGQRAKKRAPDSEQLTDNKTKKGSTLGVDGQELPFQGGLRGRRKQKLLDNQGGGRGPRLRDGGCATALNPTEPGVLDLSRFETVSRLVEKKLSTGRAAYAAESRGKGRPSTRMRPQRSLKQ